MQARRLREDEVPYFCWDRKLTVGAIRAELRHAAGAVWVRLAAWILREAAVPGVWAFLTPEEVKEHLEELAPFLHRRREFWQYLIGTWHELGRI